MAACDYRAWHERLRAVAPETRAVPLSESFISYLLADGMQLPPHHQAGVNGVANGNDSDDSNSQSSFALSDDDADLRQVGNDPDSLFPELKAEVESAIATLGGSAFPKLTWTAPKDARWVSFDNSLRCGSFLDVCMLLKSSDDCAHDLLRALPACRCDCGDGIDETEHCCSRQPYGHCLLLRRWVDVPESGEFRCFWRRGRLAAVCQRRLAACYPHLADAAGVDRLLDRIFAFLSDLAPACLPPALAQSGCLTAAEARQRRPLFRRLTDDSQAELRPVAAMPLDFHCLLGRGGGAADGDLAEMLRLAEARQRAGEESSSASSDG
uniref:Cell division cycle protein 123 homolog n=1 Tax=Macrostomum lignano TaxID=282301 RepID=A0A1I8G5R4_9PLAT